MAMISKKDLQKRSEVFLRTLQRHYNRVKKMHKLTDKQEMVTIAELKAIHAILASRVRSEALNIATSAPLLTMSHADKQELAQTMKFVNDMFNIANKCRDLSSTLAQDWADVAIQQDTTINDEKQSLLADVISEFDSVELDLDVIPVEVIECQNQS